MVKVATVKTGRLRGAVKVAVKVFAGERPATTISGKVKVSERKKKLATVRVKNARAVFYLNRPGTRSLKVGKHILRFAYTGNLTTMPSATKKTITIKTLRR